MPKCGKSASSGAEAPKPFMPIKAPRCRASGPSRSGPRPRPRRAALCRAPRPGMPRPALRRAPSTASTPPRRAMPSFASSVARRHRERDLGAGGEQGDLARALGLGQHIGAACAERFSVPCFGAQQRHVWRVSASSDGRVAPVQRQRPAFGGLDRVGRAEDVAGAGSPAAPPDARPADGSGRPRRGRSKSWVIT